MLGGLLKVLKLEGLAEGCLGVIAFSITGESWVWFAVLALVPDLVLLGYLAGPRVGGLAYNLAHSTVGPAGLAIAGLLTGGTFWIAVAAVWFAHIGFDRALGYGLKSTHAFKDTHLGEIGAPCNGNGR
jgi:Domain of unknown function (DUF4260)